MVLNEKCGSLYTCLTLRELPAGARVGTGSPRRVSQLRAMRPDLAYVDVRGEQAATETPAEQPAAPAANGG